jgi:hypothetical protein
VRVKVLSTIQRRDNAVNGDYLVGPGPQRVVGHGKHEVPAMVRAHFGRCLECHVVVEFVGVM